MPMTLRRPNGFASRKETMGEMNVTPFIDVLLVLLIMLMLAIPIQTNTTEVDLPIGDCVDCTASSKINIVHIDASDQLFWNGEAVDRDRLRASLELASAMPEEPELRFDPDAYASYDQSSRTIALIKDSGATKFAFVGNERYKDFMR